MKRLLLTLALCLLVGASAFGQTTVNLTVTDTPDNQLWNNGTWQVKLQQAAGNSDQTNTFSILSGGGSLAAQTGSLSGTATAAIVLPANANIGPGGTKWQFTVCPQASAACFQQSVTVSASSPQTLAINPPSIRINLATATPPVAAYATGEINGAALGSQFLLIGTGQQFCTAITGITCTTWASGGSSSASGVGPVINVTNPSYAGCPAAANSDWVTCFTSASAALDAASLIGTPIVRTSATATCLPCTSFPITFTVQPGDTVLLWIFGPAPSDTITISDNGGNLYRTISPALTGTSSSIALYGTAPRAAKAATTITFTDTTSRNITAIIAAVSNYGSDRALYVQNTASSTAVALTNTLTQDTNNLWLAGFNWYLAATNVTAATNSGTVLQNVTSSNTTLGEGLVSSAATTIGSYTDSLTLSNASAIMGVAVEIRSHSDVMPTLYIPSGDYNYSGGLSLLHPGILKSDGRMCYTGSAHAVDIGPTGLTINNYMRNFIVEGGFWTCGSGMTEGLFLNPFLTFAGIRNASFYNFGNSTSYMIYGTADDDDIEVGPQNRFIVDDGLPRNLVIGNANHVDINSFFRIHDNLAVCWNLPGVPAGGTNSLCSPPQAGIGFHVDSAHSRVYHNNIAFFNPDIWMDCTNGSNCFGNNIESNQLETAAPGTSGTILPAIQFSTGTDQLLIINNSVTGHFTGGAGSFLGPRTGTDLLLSSRINWNNVAQIANAQPFITLNNLAGQVGNQSLGNGCSPNLSGYLPCPILHTAGGNIGQWNADYNPKFVFAAGTTATYTFGQANYSVVPVCTIPPNIPGTATTLTISTLNVTTITITASASNSATVFGVCSSADAQ